MGLFTRSTLDSNINGAAKVGHRAVQGASDAVDTAPSGTVAAVVMSTP